MIWMWIISALAIWWVIPRLSFLEAMCIASCIAPTDPVLANSVVKGRFAEKYVPLHLRNIISAESGANDGLGFPFLYIAMYLIQMSPGPAVGKWAYYIMGYQVILSIILGFLIGYIARKSLRWAVNKNLIDKEIFLTFAVMLALFVMGSVAIIGSDELLACFIAGNSFTWDDWFRQETLGSHIQQILDMILNLAVFIYIGTIMPFSSFNNDALGLSYWRLILVAIIILLFRRLPIVMALMHKIPALKTYREGLFAGWFGPIGVGAIFYAGIAKQALTEGETSYGNAKELIKPVVFFMVLSSIAVHGISIPLIKIGKRVNNFSRTTSLNLPSVLTSSSIILRRKNDSTTGKGETVEKPNENLSRPIHSSSLSSTDDQVRVETNNQDNQEVENEIIINTEEQTSQTMLSYDKKNIPISSEVSIALKDDTVSVYDEYENTIVEDDQGRVFVIPNPP